MPVPASRMMWVSPATTSKQLVLPPKPTWRGDGQAMLPRTPQNFTLKLMDQTPDRAARLRSGSADHKRTLAEGQARSNQEVI